MVLSWNIMNTYDKLFATWLRQNAETIYQHLETSVNRNHDWRSENIVTIVVDFIGWPSEFNSQPYLEELAHILNDNSGDLGIPIPDEIIAYRLSQWTGTNVPLTHPLIKDHRKWLEVCNGIDYDNADRQDVIELINMLHKIAGPELVENLPSIEDINEHYNAHAGSGELFTINIHGDVIWLAINNDNVAAMNSEGRVVMMDFDGNQINTGQDLTRVREYIMQGAKLSQLVTDRGELASLVGNDTA